MGQYKMGLVLGLRHSDIPAPVLHEDEHGLLDRYDVAHPGHGIRSTVEPPDPVVGVVLAMNADGSPVAVTVSWAVAELYEGARRDAIATLAKHSRRVDDLRAAIYGGQP